jgi:hypothetical protein
VAAVPSGPNLTPLPTIPILKVKLSLCLTNYALDHEGIWGSGCIDPRLFDLSTIVSLSV